MKSDNHKISVVINTYNESKQLPESLSALNGFDEIVVCDMESTDNTVEIARNFGARIVTFPRGDNNICEVARDFAIHSATNQWVLVVDADEIVTPQLRDYLYDYIKRPDCADALSVPFASLFMGKFSSIKTERHIRFMNQYKAYWPPIIHSRVKIDGKIGAIKAKKELMIQHINDPSMANRINKMNRYSDNEVEKRTGRKYSLSSFLFRPWFFFYKTLILKGSIRDGRRGVMKAYMEMMYQVALLGKHYEHKLKQISRK